MHLLFPRGQTAFGLIFGSVLCATALALPEAASPLPLSHRAQSSPVPADATNLLTNAALSARLSALVGAHAAVAETFTIGNSRSGISIEGVKLSDGLDTLGKPAILVVGNIEASRVFSATIALSVAERVAASFQADNADHLLSRATLFVIPRLNVDGASARFTVPLFDDGATGHGVDNDRDGLMGEDGPADVNGDGQITWMRVPDPEGTWLPDPFDHRAQVERDASHGERGTWKVLREGFDSDGDDRVAEDAPNDGLVSRNFPAGFEEHTAAAGFFAGEEPEVRAMMDFVLAHPELALVVTFDGTDNLNSGPQTTDDPSGGRGRFSGPRTLPDGKVLESDANLLKEFGRRASAIRKESTKADAYPNGSFQRWIYEHRGLLTLDFTAWQMPTEAAKSAQEESEPVEDKSSGSISTPSEDPDVAAWNGEVAAPLDPPSEAEESAEEKPDTWREASEDAGRLKWLDASDEGARFVAWQDFDHPQLGAVQIGGWAPFALTEPPSAERQVIADAAAEFVLGLAPSLAQIEIASFTATKLSKRLWKIEAAIENNSLLPLMTKAGARARTIRPARLELVLPAKSSIIAGEAKQQIRELDGAGGRSEFIWLVDIANPEHLGLNITTDHAGTASQACTLEEK
jgi:hypothetical protein